MSSNVPLLGANKGFPIQDQSEKGKTYSSKGSHPPPDPQFF